MATIKPVTYIPMLIEASVSGAIRRVNGMEFVAQNGEKIYGMLVRLGEEGYGLVSMVVVKDINGNQTVLYALQLENRNKISP